MKKFLSTENRYGWDIKRKLVWLGTKSYLFRFFFDRYLDEINDPAKRVGTTDDFICQECTLWSGMGAIDVLAGALELPASDRTTLRNWYERHTAFYRVLTHKMSGTETEFITARNVINGETYTIRMNTARCEFTPGLLVFGALVPWHGEWYWSGEQQAFGEADETIEAGIRRDMLEKSSAIAYRYCLPEADQARELAREHHSKFVAHFGGDLVRFPDGLSLAAAEQKRLTNEWSKAPPEDVEKAMQSRGLTKPGPTMKFPPDFLRHENGIGAFSHPLEGIEYLLCFNQVISGLQKKGADLTEAEEEALCGALTCSLICPAFVHRLVSEYGAESIAAAFMLRDQPLALSLEVLLRRYKGNHYRRRYPTVSLVVS